MRLPVEPVLALGALLVLSGCLPGSGRPESQPAPSATRSGPAADFPMVLGEPFTIGETTYRPEDRLNYDAVGRSSLGDAGGAGISIAHKTLPLPSYAEVTSLESGRTVLVRVERRGPMTNERLLELSPGAAAQLGVITDGTPVRVRRVNPPEIERAALRSGRQAPERMETPKSLVAVLLRRLDGTPPAPPAVKPEPETRPAAPTPAPAPTPSPTPKPPTPKPVAAPAASPAAQGNLVVQVGAYSTRERADRAAAAVDGKVEPVGKLFRVRIGPLASQGEADAALAKARTAGYSDARIQRIR